MCSKKEELEHLENMHSWACGEAWNEVIRGQDLLANNLPAEWILTIHNSLKNAADNN